MKEASVAGLPPDVWAVAGMEAIVSEDIGNTVSGKICSEELGTERDKVAAMVGVARGEFNLFPPYGEGSAGPRARLMDVMGRALAELIEGSALVGDTERPVLLLDVPSVEGGSMAVISSCWRNIKTGGEASTDTESGHCTTGCDGVLGN
jgi:hypothetical protein